MDNHLDLHSWSSLIVKNNENSLVQCSSCENSSRCEDFHTYLSDILFIELNPAAMGTINVSQEIKVVDETYILHALVRNSGAHFSCALQLNEGWELYDDVTVNVARFINLETLFLVHSFGWFFGVYIKKNLSFQSKGNEMFSMLNNNFISLEHSYASCSKSEDDNVIVLDHNYALHKLGSDNTSGTRISGTLR